MFFSFPTGPNISTPSAVFQPFHKARADRGGAHVAVAYSGSSGMVAGLRLEDSVRCRRRETADGVRINSTLCKWTEVATVYFVCLVMDIISLMYILGII